MEKALLFIVLIMLYSCSNNNTSEDKLKLDMQLEDANLIELKKEYNIYSKLNNYSIKRLTLEEDSFEVYINNVLINIKKGKVKGEIFNLIEYINKNIYISPGTVKNYVYNILNYWKTDERLNTTNLTNNRLIAELVLDIKRIKSAIIRKYTKEFRSFGIPFNAIRAAVIRDNYNIKEGENVTFEFSVAGINNNVAPKISLKSKFDYIDTLEIDTFNSIGRYKIFNIKKGYHLINGTISLKDLDGKEFELPFETSFEVN